MSNPRKSISTASDSTGEPEQLDLFGRRPMESVQSTKANLSHSLCDQIARATCASYSQLSDQFSKRLRNTLVHTCGETHISSFTSTCHEYLSGAATALNPLPLSTPLTFITSDRLALSSDWQIVQMDIDHVWRTLKESVDRTSAESNSDERSEQEEQRRSVESERTTAG
jgi:hypothetical protein